MQSPSNEPTMTKDSRTIVPFVIIFTFSYKRLLDEIFCNMLFRIHIMFSIHHIFCINFSWINFFNFKVYKFYQILCFILKNYFKFKLYENMLIIWWFILLFHKIQLCFRCHVYYTPFTCGIELLKFKWGIMYKTSNFIYF